MQGVPAGVVMESLRDAGRVASSSDSASEDQGDSAAALGAIQPFMPATQSRA